MTGVWIQHMVLKRDPGVGHATCRETPRLAGSRSDFHPSKYSTNGLDSPQRKLSSHVKFRVELRIVPLDVAQRQ
jgi:hypothetical protein